MKIPEQRLELPVELPGDAESLLAEADVVAGDLVVRYPSDPDAYEMRARIQRYRGHTSEAVKCWQRCLELNADYAHAHEGLGAVAAQQEDHEQAETHFRQALRLTPTSAAARIGLAQALIDQGKLPEAIVLLEQSLPASPEGVEPHVLLGMAYSQQQNHAKAKEHYQAAIARDPQHANARWGLANACLRLGLSDEARQHREEFQKLRAGEREVRQMHRNQYNDLTSLKEDLAALYTDAARVYISHGAGSDAEQLWKRAAAVHPQNTSCRQALAWYYLQKQQPRDTITMLRELAGLEPDNPSYLLEVVRLYLGMNQTDAAEKTLLEVCPVGPEQRRLMPHWRRSM